MTYSGYLRSGTSMPVERAIQDKVEAIDVFS